MTTIAQAKPLRLRLDALQVLGVETAEKDVRIGAHRIDIEAHIAQKDVAVDVGQHHIETALDGRSVAENDFYVLNAIQGRFDVVLANINRNILLRDMCHYVEAMRPDAHIFFSGFYTEDLDSIKAEAERLGLRYRRHLSRNNWVAAEFVK